MKPGLITPSNLKAEAQGLIRDGKMPPLEKLLAAVSEAREKFREPIVDAQKSSLNEAGEKILKGESPNANGK